MNQYRRFAVLCHVATHLHLVAFTLAAWTSACIAGAKNIERPSDAIEVFHCNFDESWDINFDDWPDRWTRKSGPGYPHYVDIRVRDSQDEQSVTGRNLVINLDGASACVSSPPIRVISRFSYLLVTRLHLSGLKHSQVTVLIDLFDAAGKLLQTEQQSLNSGANGWQTITLESIDPHEDAIDRAIIRLDVRRVSRGDLAGKVCLDDVWLARLPRITVSTNNPYNVYRDDEDVVVRCELSGIREQNPEIRFQLLDASHNELSGGREQLDGRLIVEDTKQASDVVDGIGNAPKGYEGFIEWKPQIPRHGFYTVVVTMLSTDESGTQTETERRMDRRQIWLAVVSPLAMPPKGDFGWSLPDADHPLSFNELAGLLPNVGINWVKVPAWYDVDKPRRGDEIIRFAEMLGASNIDVVGVIDQPPVGSEIAHRLGRNATIADLVSIDQAIWLPVLDPVLSRLSMRLRYWQLGSDQDTTFVGFPNLAKRMVELRSRLFRFGQLVKLGLAWTWDESNQTPHDATWDFEQLTPDPGLTIEQFEQFVSRPRHDSIRRWVTVEPPPRVDDPGQSRFKELNARANEFVRKLVAAKQHGVDAIFISRPFDDQTGLMHENGMPAELLLPWRTTAAMLSGSKYLGAVQLPGGSENRNFLRDDGTVVMVVWNATPTREVLFLGNGAQQIDVWGGVKKLALDNHRQTVEVGVVPTFVVGVNGPIARWRMAVKFEQDHVESIFARPHPNSLEFRNFFPQGVGGTVTIVAENTTEENASEDESSSEGHIYQSDRWTIDPPQGSFNLAVGEKAVFPFDVRLNNAIYGEQPMRLDFDVDADEQHRFSVYRTMWVGSSDVTIEFKSYVDKEGTLIVQQFMTNTSERPVDFKCYLYAKGYRRQRAQVYQLGATPDRTVYRYPRGVELIGKELMLEAEEIGGERVIKFRFLVTDEPPTQEPASPKVEPARINQQSADGAPAYQSDGT